jgi:hypothetical protein
MCIQGFFLMPGLVAMFMLSAPFTRPRAFPWDLETVIAIPLFWILWAMIARGGMSFALAGISLVRDDGRRTSALTSGWRAFLVWAPLTTLLAAARSLQETIPEAVDLSWSLWIGGLVLIVGYVGLALLFPTRCVQDRLAGTVLVPI